MSRSVRETGVTWPSTGELYTHTGFLIQVYRLMPFERCCRHLARSCDMLRTILA